MYALKVFTFGIHILSPTNHKMNHEMATYPFLYLQRSLHSILIPLIPSPLGFKKFYMWHLWINYLGLDKIMLVYAGHPQCISYFSLLSVEWMNIASSLPIIHWKSIILCSHTECYIHAIFCKLNLIFWPRNIQPKSNAAALNEKWYAPQSHYIEMITVLWSLWCM